MVFIIFKNPNNQSRIFAPSKEIAEMKNIRNFCIIAHIDHGKSTLADRLLDFTGTVTEREKQNQLLDNMDLERERGITIKSHAIQMEYLHEGETYILNLIDTPGHVDFSYEVSRSIAACEGALLIVDAAQSIQAQTISNLYLALENDLEIIPVLNKVDLPSANVEEVTDDIVDLLGCNPEEIIPASAKTGLGIQDILNAIISRVPAPKGNVDQPLQALIFDSVYNPFRGVETYFRILNGSLRKGQKIQFIAHQNAAAQLLELLMRQYPYFFSESVTIEPSKVCSSLKLSKERFKDAIEQLQHRGFLQYTIPSAHFNVIPQIPREDQYTLKSVLENSKVLYRQKKHKIEAMIAYAFESNRCKRNLILNYFGSTPSGICEKCSSSTCSHDLEVEHDFENKLVQLLKATPHSILELKQKLYFEPLALQISLERLLNQQKIKQSETQKYYWIYE